MEIRGGLAMDERIKTRGENFRLTCWINERERILSFHYEEGFQQKKFTDKESYRLFILAAAEIYKVQ